MYCSQCGTQNPDAGIACVRCGQLLARPHIASMPVQYVHSHLAPAILVTLFCCLPFGIVAIVFAAESLNRSGAGDHVGALVASRRAAVWCWVAFALGLGVWFVGVLVWVFAMVFAGLLAGGAPVH
jgi:hypothetical protein